MTRISYVYAIAIGSNRLHGRHGRPAGVVQAAIAELDRHFDLFDASPILLNPASGGAGRDFANSVALIESELAPPDLLQQLKTLEGQFGRRRGKRWSSRVLDLDIVAWSGRPFLSRTLQIPHPRAEERSFVLQPLLAIAPHWRIKGPLTVRHLAGRLARRAPRR